ncbi:hypothetical protein [Nannocystis pusilla]|uniref:Uncharacterized protein n=1 Tax=Nannocystis pusilla TaxID=889268 RepID=A0ABS7TM24_9BACT|nr:hypothetical protein [Nannocystis pusilla]MBZ5709187.1 hypothetical protein [Nannocystis pusilla]
MSARTCALALHSFMSACFMRACTTQTTSLRSPMNVHGPSEGIKSRFESAACL